MSFSLQFVRCWLTFYDCLGIDALGLPFKIDAVDYPNARRINTKPMPSAGGLSIVIAFSIATHLYSMLTSTTAPIKSYLSYTLPVVGAGWIIAPHRLDRWCKRVVCRWKRWSVFCWQRVWSGFWQIFGLNDFQDSIPKKISLLHFEPWLSYLWRWFDCFYYQCGQSDWWIRWFGEWGLYYFLAIPGIVSYFFLTSPQSLSDHDDLVLVASIAGFFLNYHPAILIWRHWCLVYRIYDFSVLSLQGLENATVVAVVTPMIILGVPITDFLAIIRFGPCSSKIL